LEQFQNLTENKRYHTVERFQNLTENKRYHTVGTVPKSNRKREIPDCRTVPKSNKKTRDTTLSEEFQNLRERQEISHYRNSSTI
jgi:hypothetical protein